ncbi:lysozyme inhibitor LprI family protein [Thiothrix lacustris]|uniref:lysozyme inhibitor LprI family protein n=1 Tax=Thiothrix lacustris TaxID=525917 RepID=UPI00355B1DF9
MPPISILPQKKTLATDMKNMQLGWIKMRDAQCKIEAYVGDITSTGASEKKICLIRMTIQRSNELDIIAEKLH